MTPAWPHPRSRTAGIVAAAVVAAASACAQATDLTARCDNGAAIPVTVSNATTTPVFAWEKSCAAWSLNVTYPDSLGNPISVWGQSNPNFYNDIGSPVTYGRYANGQLTVPPAKPLVVGRSYTVTVIGWDAANGRSLFTGTGTFVH